MMKARPTRSLATASITVALMLALGPGAAIAESTGDSRRWLGPDDKPLPFRTADSLLEFLTTAPVVETKVLSAGINKPVRLTLERDGIRVRAIFRNVDVSRTSNSSTLERQFPSFRDRYVYEVAAYEMSRMLGLDNVPPAALYEWQGQQGSIQLWVENATSEADRIERGEAPADEGYWHRQRLDMQIFDNLIFNFDRNHGNQLLDANGKLWFIDHTRSFKRAPSLPAKDDILMIDSGLWNRLRTLGADEVRKTLKPYLNVAELKALLKRHQLLIRHIEKMIQERGERQVLINIGRAGEKTPIPASP